MKARVSRIKGLRFSDDERIQLAHILGKGREVAVPFLNHIEIYMAPLVHGLNDSTAANTTSRRNHEVISDILKQTRTLKARLQQLHLGGAGGYILEAEFRASRTISRTGRFLEQISEYEHLLRSAKSLMPRPRRGRAESVVKLRFIEQVARAYRHEYKRLPPTSAGGRFHALIIQLLGLAGRHETDCSRLVRKAIDNIKNDRWRPGEK